MNTNFIDRGNYGSHYIDGVVIDCKGPACYCAHKLAAFEPIQELEPIDANHAEFIRWLLANGRIGG